MKFAERLRELRLEANLSQEQLGDRLKVTKANISKYETGRIEPNLETLTILSEIFNVSVDYFLGKTDIKNSNKTQSLPIEFNSPEEAMKFVLEQNVIMGFGGFDVEKMSDEEIVEFANELLRQLKVLSYKYKK